MAHSSPRIVRLSSVIVLASLAVFGTGALAFGDLIAPTPSLPPVGGAYQAMTDAEYNFGGGLDVDARFTSIAPIAGTNTQTFFGGSEFDSYQATVAGVVSATGPGGTFSPFTLTASITTDTIGRTSDTQLGTFDSVVTAFDFTTSVGGGNTVTGKLAPSSLSTGQTTISTAGSDFRIHSFFDIFTEISLDGGAFVPNTGPSGNPSQPPGTVDGSTFFQLESVPAPTSLVLLTSGAVFGLFGAVWQRRRRGSRRLD